MRATLLLVYVCCLFSIALCAIPSPIRFATYLLDNRWESGLPLSYYVYPGYFQSIPINERPKFYTDGEVEPQCDNQWVDADKMNAYVFQTEELLTIAGLNLYDGAMWQIAVSLLKYIPEAEQYQQTTLIEHKTLQFANIKADQPCRGVIEWGQCKDSEETGGCGFCYGDYQNKTLDTDNAYFFRMVSDVWSFDGANDVRCPELFGQPNYWKWNDYRPVTGENSWASLIGPLQTAFLKAGTNVNNIPDNSPAFTLAFDILVAIRKMLIVSHGAVYYAPRNTWDSSNPAIGDSVSTENNISLLAGLKMLLHILQTRSSRAYDHYIPEVQDLVGHITNYIRSAYNHQYGYFSQGGNYTGEVDKKWTWVQEPYLAVDCQTWVITVLGRQLIDGWFGEGTCMHIWNVTKQIGGYQYNSQTKWARGVGFTDNQQAQVFSGEWSLGAINMLYTLAYSYPEGHTRQALIHEAEYMRLAIETDLVKTGKLDEIDATGVYYANKRYFIPFGWYANPLWSTASTAWTVAMDLHFNPFYLGGAFKSIY